jgi:methyl-accepting chemotaxis protein
MKMSSFKISFSSLTVRTRLIGLITLLGLMLLGGAAIGLGSMALQKEGLRKVYEEELVPTQLLDRINTRSLMSFISMGEAASLIAKSQQAVEKIKDYKQYDAELAELMKQYDAIPASPEVQKAIKDWRSTDKDYISAKQDMTDALEHSDASASDVLDMEVRPLLMQRQAALGKLIEVARQESQGIYQTQTSRYQYIRAISIAAVALGLLLAIVVGVWLVRSITGALNRAVTIAHAIAEGQLGHDIHVKGDDELARLLEAFRTMDQRLATIVADVRHGSGAVSTAAQQIARGNDDLSQRTQEQASSLEETASSMEEMTSTVKQNAENASQANQLARGAREQAERGGDVVAQAVTAMSEINNSSRKISDIVSLIDEIAFQTNLLALNAAVEAARAGEQGRGFAVVATEVRNLAQRSAGAAKEIKLLIKDSADKVRVGSELVDQSGKALAEIVDSVKKVTDIVAEIAAASQEQSAGIDQVNNAVSQMDEMTQQNAALVEEASAAARAMHEQASELTRQVGFFHLSSDVVAAPVAAKVAPAAGNAVAEAEAVFAAVRQSSPKVAPRTAETADSGAWKEF